ncbi:MAG: malate synthase A, partial [Specibacter sp.]
MNSTNSLNGITFNGITLTEQPIHRQNEILTPEALDFIAALNRSTTARRTELLAARKTRRTQILSGTDPRYLSHTSHIREDPNWRVAPPAPGLEDR